MHIGPAPGAAGYRIFDQDLGRDSAGSAAAGERIRVEGYVFDGIGAPVKDVMLEVWQADAAGIYPHPEDTLSTHVVNGLCGWAV